MANEFIHKIIDQSTENSRFLPNNRYSMKAIFFSERLMQAAGRFRWPGTGLGRVLEIKMGIPDFTSLELLLF